MLKERVTTAISWLDRHWRAFALPAVGLIIGLLLVFQILWPTARLAPFTTIENTNLGGVLREDAVKMLDQKFVESKVGVYLNNSETAFIKATPGELGIASSNKDRVEAMDYPWYLRIIPTSLFWAHLVSEGSLGNLQYHRSQDTLSSYINTTVGDTCHRDVRNGSAEVKGENVRVVEAFSGGDCDINELTTVLKSVNPTSEGAHLSIAGTEVLPVITTKKAQAFVNHVNKIMKDGVAINDGKNSHDVPKKELVKWIDFTSTDGKLDYSFSIERASGYLAEKVGTVVEKPTGTMTITLKDFAEQSRDTGQTGVVFNKERMLQSIKTSLEKGERKVAVEVDTIQPTAKYVRTYSEPSAALNDVLKKYAESHPGTYGVSLRELSGDRRNASYRASTQYTTASTYKLFVAYSVLLRIESGAYKWTDVSANGKNLSECFDDMIELSDNDCAVNLLRKVGFKAITADAQAIGATKTSFLRSDDIKSTAEDESLLLGLLESGQILSQQTSRDKWITAMKKNVYQQGIPKGVPLATVADKVGFLDALLHDAAIVYSPKGTYVLVIMTDNASWANIAELAKQIETAR
jgi:beta-lactamase class A